MNKFLQTLLGILILPILGAQLHAQAPQYVIDEVVWMVGDEPILRSDIEGQKILLLSEGQSLEPDADCFLAEQLAVQMLLLNQAAIDSITVDDNMINRYVEGLLNQTIAEIGSQEKVEEYFHKPLSQIRAEQQRVAKNGEVARAMRNEIVKDVEVSPSDIKDFYATLKADTLPYVPATVEVQLLKLTPKVSVSETDRIKQSLLEYARQVNDGERDFSSLARLYSQDQRTALQGGEYGFVGKGSLEPEFAQVLFNLPVSNRVSPIIESKQGFHIVQIIEKKNDLINFRQILLRPQVDQSELEKCLVTADSVLNLINAGGLSMPEAVQIYSSDEESKNNAGLLINSANYNSPRNGSSYFTLEELPQEVSKEVDLLKPGQYSKPFIMQDENGRTHVAVALLKSFNAGHRANLTDDFQVIKSLALTYKKQQVLDDWIKAHIRSTYVYVSPDFRGCTYHYQGWF